MNCILHLMLHSSSDNPLNELCLIEEGVLSGEGLLTPLFSDTLQFKDIEMHRT